MKSYEKLRILINEVLGGVGRGQEGDLGEESSTGESLCAVTLTAWVSWESTQSSELSYSLQISAQSHTSPVDEQVTKSYEKLRKVPKSSEKVTKSYESS